MPILSDRVKRRAILRSTALLPRRLRLSTRYRLLANLEVGKARRASSIIIGHPKSGNTWLRTMIARAYQIKYGSAADRRVEDRRTCSTGCESSAILRIQWLSTPMRGRSELLAGDVSTRRWQTSPWFCCCAIRQTSRFPGTSSSPNGCHRQTGTDQCLARASDRHRAHQPLGFRDAQRDRACPTSSIFSTSGSAPSRSSTKIIVSYEELRVHALRDSEEGH